MYAIVFGCEKFCHFIYGKHVDIETDHKSLEAITKNLLHKYLLEFNAFYLDCRVMMLDLLIDQEKNSIYRLK